MCLCGRVLVCEAPAGSSGGEAGLAGVVATDNYRKRMMTTPPSRRTTCVINGNIKYHQRPTLDNDLVVYTSPVDNNTHTGPQFDNNTPLAVVVVSHSLNKLLLI